jgi:excisionase family DNA binding protein
MAQFLTVRQAADALGLKAATIRAWLSQRKHLPFIRCGRAVRIDLEAIQKFIVENTVPTREPRREPAWASDTTSSGAGRNVSGTGG